MLKACGGGNVSSVIVFSAPVALLLRPATSFYKSGLIHLSFVPVFSMVSTTATIAARFSAGAFLGNYILDSLGCEP